MNTRRKEDNCIAVIRSPIPYHVLKIPVVNVGIAKCSTAPKSDKVSIVTSINPPMTAGRIIGIASLKDISNLFKPKILPDSSIDLD